MTARSIVGVIAWCVAAGLWAAPSLASANPTKPAAKASSKAPAKRPARKPAAKPSAKAKPAAAPVATEPAQTPGLTEAQLSAASQVLVGQVDCEFEQKVMVEPHATLIGSFRVKHNSRSYLMVPEETTTGAVRLADAKAGVVWLQIPVKSMMMNTRAGRRMVDACTHPTQRQAKADEDAARVAAEAAAAQAAALAATLPPGSPTISQTVHSPALLLPTPLLISPTEPGPAVPTLPVAPASPPAPPAPPVPDAPASPASAPSPGHVASPAASAPADTPAASGGGAAPQAGPR